NDRSGGQQRSRLLRVGIGDAPAILVIAYATQRLGLGWAGARRGRPDVRVDRLHALGLAASMKVWLKRRNQRRLLQTEVPVAACNLARRNIEFGHLTHVLREYHVLGDNTFRIELEPDRDADRGLLTIRVQVKVEMNLRPRLDEAA